MDSGQKLQHLYDQEINFAIETFWAAGFTAKLGDAMNGFTAKGQFDTLDHAVDFLLQQAGIDSPPSQPEA